MEYIMYSSTSEESSCTDDSTSDTESVCSTSSSLTSGGGPSGRRQRGRREGGKKRQKRSIVWVGNLSATCTPQQLLQHFSNYRSCIRNKPRMIAPKNKDSSEQCFTFLHFDTPEKASEVIQSMNNTKFQGKKILVKDKKEKKSSHKVSSQSSSLSSLSVQAVAGNTFISQEDPSDDSDDDSVFSTSSQSTDSITRKQNNRNFSVRVNNLSPGCTSEQILNHFSSYKSAIINKKVKIITSKKSPGYSFAFLNFRSLDKANEVVEKMNKTTFQKKKLTLKLQEQPQTGDRDSSNGRQSTTPGYQSNTGVAAGIVRVMNVPSGMDCSDLKGLVAQLQPLSCSISGQEGTLTFSSSQGAHEALRLLDKKLVYGVHLRAVTETSLIGEPVHLPSSVSPIPMSNPPQGGRQGGKRSSDPSPISLPHGISPCVDPSTSFPHHVMSRQRPPHYVMSPQGPSPRGPLLHRPPPPHRVMSYQGPSPGGSLLHGPPHRVMSPRGPSPGGSLLHGPPPFTLPRQSSFPYDPRPIIQPYPPQLSVGQPLSPPRGHFPMPGISNTQQQGHNQSSSNSHSTQEKAVSKKNVRAMNRRNKVFNKRISYELYSMICRSDEAVIHVFKSNDVTIDYVNPTHTVIVCGPSNQVHSVEQHFEKYCEKELQCSPLQWTTLVENGKRLLNELIGPFQHNPAVNIIEKSRLLLVVGLTDAVIGAHQYLFKSLNKSIKAESFRITLLTQLQPNLPDLIHSLYGITITGYVDGSSTIELQDVTDDAIKVHQLINEMLSSLCHTTVPLLSSPLIESAEGVCSSDNIPVVTRVVDNELILWCLSPESLDKAKNIFTRKPYFNKIALTRFNEACLYFAFSEKFSFQYVSLRKECESVILDGFNKQDVQSAKNEVLKFLNDNFKKQQEKIVEEFLCCTSPQLAYLTRSLQSDELTKSLSAKISIQDGQISIKGTKDEVKEASESLLDSVPLHSSHVFEGKNVRFIPSLLKQHILMTTDHIIENSEGKDKKLTLYLFNNHRDTLEELKKTLNNIDPSVLFFTVSPKSKAVVKKLLNDLERQERCRIDLLKHDTPGVAVHGLTRAERTRVKDAIRDYIEENYIVIKEIPSPHISGLHMKYMLTKHGEELKELAKNLKQCNIPFELSRKPSFDFSSDPDVFIKVVGTSKAINSFDESFATFSNGFTVEQFQISIPNIHRFPWRKRWNVLKQEADDTQAVVLEYRLPRREERNSAVSFLIYGTQSETIQQLKDTIEYEASAGTVGDKIKLSNELVGKVQVALRDKQLLNFDDYMVEIKCVEKDEIIYINSLAVSADCVELVKTEIKGYIECTDTGFKETINFDDSLVYAIFCSKKLQFYSNAISIGKKVKVSILPNKKARNISLSGSKALVDVVKNQVQMLISQIKTSIDSREMIVESDLQCALTPSVKSAIERKLLADSCVQVTYKASQHHQSCSPSTSDIIKTISFKLSNDSSVVELVICNSMVTAQSTDVMVVPVSTPDLQHVSEYAQDVLHRGGPVLQKECNRLMSFYGVQAVGEVVSTGSGALQCDCVIHAVTPVWEGGRSSEKENLYTAVFNSLSDSIGHSSVSFPALGCEAPFRVPHDFCAEMSLKAIRDFYYCHPNTSLKKVVFVLLKEGLQTSFLEVLEDVFPSDSLLSFNDGNGNSLPQWLWINDQQGYSPYSADDCRRIESAYQRSRNEPFHLMIGSSLYTIDFQRMVQLNNTTFFKRDIKRGHGGGTTVGGGIGGCGQVTWYWINDTGRLTPYTSTEITKIEAMYRLKSPGMMHIGGQFYQFDFHNMVQKNILSGNVRRIDRKRDMDTRHDSRSIHQNKSIPNDSVIITLRGPKAFLESCEKEINDQLRRCIREEEILISSKVGQEFMSKVTEITSKHSVIYELKTTTQHQGKKALIIKGVNVDRAVNELQRYIIEQQNTNEDIDVPPEWRVPQTNTTELFPLVRGTREWIKVEQGFSKTMASYSIKEIVRIQNLYLWEKWVEERKRIEKFKNCVNEMELFHGTGKNDPKLIYDSEIGFDMRFCSSGMWGQANYFAVNASYSHSYAHTNPTSGVREMFLVQLITGDSYQSDPNKSLRMPPLKTGSNMGLSQVRYDTVNGVTRGSQVYMSYDNQKAYPAYLIRYQP